MERAFQVQVLVRPGKLQAHSGRLADVLPLQIAQSLRDITAFQHSTEALEIVDRRVTVNKKSLCMCVLLLSRLMKSHRCFVLQHGSSGE